MMAKTYAELHPQLGIEPDPFAIRGNIFLCMAHLHHTDDRYGTVGTAGAYSAGPGRREGHPADIQPLPNGTVGCLGKLGPVLGFGAAGSVNSVVSPSAHSSFESPLFGALASTQAMLRPEANRQRVLAIFDANTTIRPECGGLFVRSSNVDLPMPNDQQINA